LLDTAVAGTTSITTDSDITLTTTTGASNQARQAIILWNPASGTTTRNITAPAQSKLYTVINASGGTQSIVIRGVGPTTGVTIAKGESATVAWNGSDFVKVGSSGGAITFTDLTVTGNTILGDAAADTLTVNATSTFASPVSFQGLVRLPSTGRSAAAALTVTAPAFLYGVASTYTDTTSSGTIGAMAPFYSIAQPTLSTSNVTTYTNAATLYIANAPTTGGSATITNPYALYVASGANYFGGAVTMNSSLTVNGNTAFGDANSDTTTVLGTATITTTDIYATGSSLAITRTQNGNGNGGYGLNVNISNTGTPSGNSLYGVYIDAYAGGGAGHTIWGLFINRGAFFLGDSGTIGKGTSSSSAAAEIVLNSGTANKYSDVDFAFGGVTKWRFGTNGGDNIQVYNSSAGATAASWDLSTNQFTQQTSMLLTRNTAGAAPSFTIDNASNDGGVGTKMYLTNSGTGTKYNWLMGTQLTVNDTLQFVPSTTVGGATYSNATLTLYADGSAGVRNTLYAGYGSFGDGGTGTAAGEIQLNAGSGSGGKYADVDFSFNSTKIWRVGTNGNDNMNIFAHGVGTMLTQTSAGVFATYNTSGGTNMVANSTGIGAGDSPATVLGTRAIRVYSTAGADIIWKGGAATRSWAMHAGTGGNLELVPSDNTGTGYRTAWEGSGAMSIGVAPDATRRLYVSRVGDYSNGYNIYAYRAQDNNNSTGVSIRGEITNNGTPGNSTYFAMQALSYDSNNSSNGAYYGLFVDAYQVGSGTGNTYYGIYHDRGNNFFNRTSGNTHIGNGELNNGGKLNITSNDGIGIRSTSGGNAQVIQPWFQDSVAQNTWYTVTTFSNQYEGAFFMLMVGYEYDAGDGNNRFSFFTASAASAYAGGIGTTLVSGSSNLECQVANVGGTWSLQVRQTFNGTATGVFRVMLFRLVGN
jgi:hypothetical protein